MSQDVQKLTKSHVQGKKILIFVEFKIIKAHEKIDF